MPTPGSGQLRHCPTMQRFVATRISAGSPHYRREPRRETWIARARKPTRCARGRIPPAAGAGCISKRPAFSMVGPSVKGLSPKGYGEETDFCQRASHRGWIHLLAGDVFVFHLGETSFGASSEERKAKALAIMRKRYPAYEQSVARWVGLDPALSLRLAATAALWRLSKRPVVLHVLHSWGGGTEKYVAELAARLAPSALQLVLVAKRRAQHVRFF